MPSKKGHQGYAEVINRILLAHAAANGGAHALDKYMGKGKARGGKGYKRAPASKAPTAKQLAARERFTRMAKSGELKAIRAAKRAVAGLATPRKEWMHNADVFGRGNAPNNKRKNNRDLIHTVIDNEDNHAFKKLLLTQMP